MEERWFSTSEIAAYLGVKPDKVYRLIGSEGLFVHKIGRFWKFNLADSCITLGVLFVFWLLWRADNQESDT